MPILEARVKKGQSLLHSGSQILLSQTFFCAQFLLSLQGGEKDKLYTATLVGESKEEVPK
jgi:hypothetical protein